MQPVFLPRPPRSQDTSALLSAGDTHHGPGLRQMWDIRENLPPTTPWLTLATGTGDRRVLRHPPLAAVMRGWPADKQ